MDKIQETVIRVRQMEQCFDTLREAVRREPGSVWRDGSLHALLERLTQYYDGGQWLRDYETDEAGLLPEDLKRGVLAEDAVYNFLQDVPREKEE